MAIITNIVTGTSMIQAVLADSQETKFIVLPIQGTAVDFCVCCRVLRGVSAGSLGAFACSRRRGEHRIGSAAICWGICRGAILSCNAVSLAIIACWHADFDNVSTGNVFRSIMPFTQRLACRLVGEAAMGE